MGKGRFDSFLYVQLPVLNLSVFRRFVCIVFTGFLVSTSFGWFVKFTLCVHSEDVYFQPREVRCARVALRPWNQSWEGVGGAQLESFDPGPPPSCWVLRTRRPPRSGCHGGLDWCWSLPEGHIGLRRGHTQDTLVMIFLVSSQAF